MRPKEVPVGYKVLGCDLICAYLKKRRKIMREKEHRCLWCGAITDSLGMGRFRIQTCSNCKRQYTYHTDGSMYKIYGSEK